MLHILGCTSVCACVCVWPGWLCEYCNWSVCVCVCGVQVLHSTAVLQVSLDHPPTRSSITTHMQRTIDLSNDIHFID